MSFDTSDAAKDYYNFYIHHTGFSIRIDTSRESKKAVRDRPLAKVARSEGNPKGEQYLLKRPAFLLCLLLKTQETSRVGDTEGPDGRLRSRSRR